MADNIETKFQQRPQRSDSSATGWIIGVIIALIAIGALWYYGTRSSELTTGTSNTTNKVTTEPPPAPGTPAPSTTTETTGSGASTGSTTTPAPAPAPAQAPATP